MLKHVLFKIRAKIYFNVQKLQITIFVESAFTCSHTELVTPHLSSSTARAGIEA